MSADEMKAIIHEQGDYINKLHNAINGMNLKNLYMRLDYLFRVVENSDKFESSFVDEARTEIATIMRKPNQEKADEVQ